MKKRVFLFLFLLTAFIGRSYAEEHTYQTIGSTSAVCSTGQTLTYTIVHDLTIDWYFARLTGYVGTIEGALVIPDSITYSGDIFPVGWIGYHSLSGSDITSVTIPSPVRCIDESPFLYCNNLDTVNYNIDSGYAYDYHHTAFHGCNFTKLNIGNNVKVIGWYAFEGCSGLTSVTIPNSVTEIRPQAFLDCSGLTTVNFNADSCTMSELYYSFEYQRYPIFDGCSNLTTLNIGNNVKAIPEYAFNSCSGLTSVTIPSAVTYIGEGAFYECSNLRTVNFNADSCTFIGYNQVFGDYGNLTTLNIGSNVKIIPNNAFSNYSGITSLTLPNSLTSIGSSAFSGCSGITSLTLPNSLTSIGSYAFEDCSGITSLTMSNSLTSIGSSAFYGCSGITSLTLPNSLISIGEYAFGGCSGLTSLTLPDALETIGEGAFYVCSGLTTVSIPRTVKYIGDAAFGGCEGLTSVDMHADSCTYMGSVSSSSGSVYSAFYNCPNLATLNIDENVKNIPAAAFAGCTGLMSLRVPSSVERIGDRAFSDCYNISRIDMLSDVPPSIMGGTFYNVATTVPIWVPCGASETYRNASFWSMFINYHEDCGSEGIDPAEAEGCRIAAESGVLRIEGAAGKSVRIFDMAGRLLVSEDGAQESQRFAMPAGGVYLVQVGEAPAQKVVVVK